MARKLRVEFEGAFYHVMNRGDRREDIFVGDADRHLFLELLGQACAKTGWKIHAYVLMSNHYHLMVETPQGNLVAGMQWLQNTYTIRFNRRHRLSGHLFQGRYKAVLVDPEERSYFLLLADYIHLNAVRARLLKAGESILKYSWSSLTHYGSPRGRRPIWLEVTAVLGEDGLRDCASGRRRFLERMEGRKNEELARAGRQSEEPLEVFRRGWVIGGKAFRDRMVDRIEGLLAKKVGEPFARSERHRDHGLELAQRLLDVGLDYFELTPADLRSLRKGDARKRIIGHLISRNTTAGLAWIGQRLQMGERTRVSRNCGSLETLKNARQGKKDAAAIYQAALKR
jgi:REP element-mobilizing transposase RayT